MLSKYLIVGNKLSKLNKSFAYSFVRLASTASTSNNKDHYDIIISGGGMVGTTLACTLGRNKKLSDKRILLLEAGREFNWAPSDKYSNRVVALNPSTRELLSRIGAWKHIEAVRFGDVKKLQVWDGISDSMITFNNEDLSENVAYIVENNLILKAVNEEIKAIGNVNVVNEVKVKACNLPMNPDDEIKVNLENGDAYSCDLLLGCDGAKSQVRDAMGVQYLSWDYKQMGLVATLKLAEGTGENVVAWQRFLPTGPVAVLPLNSTTSSLVWSNTKENAKRLLNLPPEQFIDELNDAIWKVQGGNGITREATKFFDNVLRSLIKCPSDAVRQLPPHILGVEDGSRAVFPLGFGHASNYVGKGVALVGDAAHRVHPLGGQGVNLGFGDVACLDEILGEAVYSGRKLGSLIDLKQYETERQRHNVPTMFALDGLHKLYTTDFTPVVLLRSLGLQITQTLTPLKRAIIRQAAY